MKKIHCCLILIQIAIAVVPELSNAQTGLCFCAKNDYTTDEKPDTVFTFSNNKQIYLCGYRETQGNQIIYSEFILGLCNTDTLLGFWGAVRNCIVKKSGDSLIVYEVFVLPIGENFAPKKFPLKVTTYCFNGELLLSTNGINAKFKKYSPDEIKLVLESFKKNSFHSNGKNILLLKQLFVAALSGSEEANKAFIDMDEKIKDNAESLEVYDDLKAQLEFLKD